MSRRVLECLHHLPPRPPVHGTLGLSERPESGRTRTGVRVDRAPTTSDDTYGVQYQTIESLVGRDLN